MIRDQTRHVCPDPVISSKQAVPLLEQVRQIFRMMLQYCNAADSLCNYALAEASRQESLRDIGRVSTCLTISWRQRRSSNSQTTSIQGIDSPVPPPLGSSNPETSLEGIRERLEEYSAEFRALAVTLIAQLGQAPDLDHRFLALRLNFNYHFSELGISDSTAEVWRELTTFYWLVVSQPEYQQAVVRSGQVGRRNGNLCARCPLL